MPNSGIIDTCILIDCLRGRTDSTKFLIALAAQQIPTTHVIVVAELLAGARNKREQDAIDLFLGRFTTISPDAGDGFVALQLYRRFHLSHGVDWPDCQIAATAIRLNADVYTQNLKHFEAFPGMRAVRAY
jgi:predicted nucleic acid-binding protein